MDNWLPVLTGILVQAKRSRKKVTITVPSPAQQMFAEACLRYMAPRRLPYVHIDVSRVLRVAVLTEEWS